MVIVTSVYNFYYRTMHVVQSVTCIPMQLSTYNVHVQLSYRPDYFENN